MKPEIQITEEFDSPSGEFANYDTGDSITQATLDGKKHLDLRSFITSPSSEHKTMFWLDQRTIGETEADDMTALEGTRFVGLSETWTNGAAGKIGSLNNRYGLSWTLSNGTNTTASAAEATDLSDFTTGDFITIALPNFPATVIDQTQSWLRFSDGTTTVSYKLSDSLTTITAGNSEGRWANTLGTLKPTTVTLVLQANIVTYTNKVTNPSFETNTTGWSGSGTITRDTSWGQSGTASGRQVYTVTNNDSSLYGSAMSVTAGQAYSASVYYKIGSGHTVTTGGPRLIVQFDNGSNTWGLSPAATSTIAVPAVGATNKLSLTNFTAPTGATQARFRLLGGQTTGTQTSDVLWDAALFVSGSTLPNYFDGSTSGYHWTGTANASTSTSDTTVVTVAAIRLVSPTWTASKIDINTRTQNLAPSINLNGTIPSAALPQVWRADTPTSSVDPRPYDAKLGVVFNTGSMTHDNSIILYFRGRREDYWTQLDIDGEDTNADGIVDIGYDQGTLDAVKKQPDYGRAVYNPNPQSDLDTFIQEDVTDVVANLDGIPQAWMERVQDNISASWVQAELRWGTTETAIYVRNTETLDTDAYKFTPTLSVNTNYLLSVKVEEDTIQAWIYSLNEFGVINTLVYTTNLVVDDFMFKRRKGRVGWKIDLNDGDAYVGNFRSQELMFGEFVTHPLESFTPVIGGRLIVGASSDRELYTGADAWENGTVAVDNANSNSDDGSIKASGIGLFGIQTEPINIDDFRRTKITFDVFSRGEKVRAALANENDWFIPLNMPPLAVNKWTSVKIVPRVAELEQTGKYRLVLYSAGNVQNDFWIDNISIVQRMIVWSARSAEADPWGQYDPQWTEFEDLVNTDSGVMFRDRGTKAQVRGQALSPNATIDKVYFMPKYAELGRFVWDVVGRRHYE